MNVYHEHPDLYVEHLLTAEDDLALSFRVMYDQQMPFQMLPRATDIGRSYILFIKDDPLPHTNKWFQEEYGLSIYEWFALGFGAAAATMANELPLVKAQALEDFDHWTISREAIDSFLRESSRTVAEVAEQYREDRERMDKPYLLGVVPSGFLAKPFLKFGSDVYLAPAPALAMRHATDGIYLMCRKNDDVFGKELSASYERYVGAVLEELAGAANIVDPDVVAEATVGKSCDYVVELPDAILLVECKAVSFTVRILMERSIRNDNSTTKIVDGLEQLLATAEAVRGGALDHLLRDSQKPLLASVVTHGEIPMVNSPWYRDVILRPRLDDEKILPEQWPAPFVHWPQILHISWLEEIVQLHRLTGDSLLSIVADKEGQSYLAVGEWDIYLANAMTGKRIAPFPLTHAATDDFYEGLVGAEHLESLRARTQSMGYRQSEAGAQSDN